MEHSLESLLQIFYTSYVAWSVVIASILYYILNVRGLPPGPWGLPYLGYWPFLKDDTCHLQLTEMAKKYGDVFSFTITGHLYVHMGSVKVVRDAHVTKSDCFYERSEDFSVLRDFLDNGVVYLKGEAWKTVRKFFLQQFRERGMNTVKEALSGPMYDTIRETVAELKTKNGQTVDIASILSNKCNKIMRQTLFGNDGMSDDELREFNKHYYLTLASLTSVNSLIIGKFAKYLITPFTKSFQAGKKGHIEMRRILHAVIQRRKSTFDENNVRDCIDAFLKERKARQDKNDPTAKYFTDEILEISLIQIVGDGTLFVAMFVAAFLKALMTYPEEQEKIYQELAEVVGVSRNPEMEDKSKLTYTNAFVSEVMRTNDMFTMFPAYECAREITLNGYRIPKGAITVYNFWAAHMNPNDYEKPEKFMPSRFIVPDGKKRPDILPLFGLGKRSCMGEGFAMIQVFLFLTTIVKNFRLTKPADEKDRNIQFFNFDKLNVCPHLRNQN